jgi:hypothetical protein
MAYALALVVLSLFGLLFIYEASLDIVRAVASGKARVGTSQFHMMWVSATFTLVLSSLPLYCIKRWWDNRLNWQGPLPSEFRSSGRGGYAFGMGCIWLAHFSIALFLAGIAALASGLSTGNTSGVVLGLVIIPLYCVGFISVEASLAGWRKSENVA